MHKIQWQLCSIWHRPARFGKQYTTVCMGDGCSKYCTGWYNKNVQGFYTLQHQKPGKEDAIDTVSHDNTRNTTGTLCTLYAKAAKRQDMNFHDYYTHIHNLNTDSNVQ